MSLWDNLPAEELIWRARLANAGNYSWSPKRWTEQLEEIRALPETPRPGSEPKP